MRGAQQWALMPFGALVGSVMPSIYMRGNREQFHEGDVSRVAGFALLTGAELGQ